LQHTNYNDLSLNARKKVLKDFESEVVARKYVELYESVLEE
jgi:glycosyltransferase involved in cell wall biosynthesis